jgi:hypothetical protein
MKKVKKEKTYPTLITIVNVFGLILFLVNSSARPFAQSGQSSFSPWRYRGGGLYLGKQEAGTYCRLDGEYGDSGEHSSP